MIALGESLAIGFRALAISAQYAAQEEGTDEDGKPNGELTRTQLIFAFAIAIGFAIALFKVSPALITNWLPIEGTSWFVIVEGLIRVTIFIGYLVAANYWSGITNPMLSALADPLGINALKAMTAYWTASERNTRLIGFPSMLLWNRLLWLGIATALFGVLQRTFRVPRILGSSVPRVGEPRNREPEGPRDR